METLRLPELTCFPGLPTVSVMVEPAARLQPRASKVVAAGFAALATCLLAAWVVCNAAYLSDDYLMIGGAGSSSLEQSLATWANEHFDPRPADAWPKFYRPLWRLLFLVDAHVFRCDPRLSLALSLCLHATCCFLVARIVARLNPESGRGAMAAGLALLPSAALEAPLWVAARGSLLTALATLAGVLIALSPRWSALGAAAALVGLALAAMSGHESGVLAVPIWAMALLCTRPGWRRALPCLVAPAVACVGFMALRAHVLGTWVGGYKGAAESASLLGVVASIGTGIAAIVVPGSGRIPGGVLLACGLAGSVLLAALLRGRHAGGARSSVWLGLSLMILPLCMCVGSVFRSGPSFEGSRYLYLPYLGWCLLVGCLVPRGVAFQFVVYLLGPVTWIAAAVAAHDYVASGRVARSILATALESRAGANVALWGIPDRLGMFMCLGNALPAALNPPFSSKPHSIRGHATEGEIRSGELLGMLGALPMVPDVERWVWDGTRLEPVGPELGMEAVWRGELTKDEKGGWSVSGLGMDGELSKLRADGGGIVEARGTIVGGAKKSMQAVSVTPARPCLREQAADGGRAQAWVFEGAPGDALFLLLGNEVCAFVLGQAGTVGISAPRYEFVGVVGAGEKLVVTAERLRGATWMQALVMNGPRVELCELRMLH